MADRLRQAKSRSAVSPHLRRLIDR